jgi:hypothetical protein
MSDEDTRSEEFEFDGDALISRIKELADQTH